MDRLLDPANQRSVARSFRLPYEPKPTDSPFKVYECATMVESNWKSAVGNAIIENNRAQALHDARTLQWDHSQLHFIVYITYVPYSGLVYGPVGRRGEEPSRPTCLAAAVDRNSGPMLTNYLMVTDGRNVPRASIAHGLSLAFAAMFHVLRSPQRLAIPAEYRSVRQTKITIFTDHKESLLDFNNNRTPTRGQLYEDDDTRMIITRSHYLQALGVDIDLRWTPVPLCYAFVQAPDNPHMLRQDGVAADITMIDVHPPEGPQNEPPAFGMELLFCQKLGKMQASAILGACYSIFYQLPVSQRGRLAYDYPEAPSMYCLGSTHPNVMPGGYDWFYRAQSEEPEEEDGGFRPEIQMHAGGEELSQENNERQNESSDDEARPEEDENTYGISRFASSSMVLF